jgi:hypothetical protein
MPRIKTGSPFAMAEEDPESPGVKVIAAEEGMRITTMSTRKSMPYPYLANVDCPVIMIIFCYPVRVKEH